MDFVHSAMNLPIWQTLAGVWGTATPSAPSTAGATGAEGELSQYFMLKVKNSSRLQVDFFVLGKGQDPAYYHDGNFKMIESYMLFDGNGVASFVPATRAEASGKYAKKLSEFPNDPHDSSVKVITIPKTIGGRLYFSLAEPVILAIVEGKDPAGHPVTKTLAEPDPFKLDDPSYLVIYDKIEFTFNDMGVWIDTTAVDFFCMPISLYFEGKPETSVGISKARSVILNTLQEQFVGPWARLRLAYINPDSQQSVLRILAPNKAIGRHNPEENFPEDYLQGYIRAVWDYYRATGATPATNDHTLKVDCSELIGFGFPLEDVKGGKLTAENAMFTGWVTPDGTVFHFENSTKDNVDITLPLSNQVFGCDGGSMTARPNHVSSVIVRELGAAMTVGLLPLPNQMTNPLTGKLEDVNLCQPFFTRPDIKKMFYNNSPLLPAPGPSPCYNLYSKVLHSFGEKVYAFAFDDAVGEDSTLHSSDTDPHVPKVSTPYVVVIGDMQGTVLPDLTDNTKYNITLAPGWGGTGSYTSPDGQHMPFTWPNSLTITDVKSPFLLQYDIGDGMNTYEVTVHIRRVRCTTSATRVFLGVDWTFHGNDVTIALEGKPR